MLSESGKRLGNAWLYLTGALVLHALDEAIHNFLDFYLEEVFSLGLPLPIFTTSSWTALLVVVTLFLLLLAPYAYREQGPIRTYAKVFAVTMFLNGLVHLLGSIVLGRLLPGVYSSPLLLWFAWLLFRRASVRAARQSA
jgi:hypothetical protein